METGDDGGPLDLRLAGKVEIIVLVLEGQAARLFAQSVEEMRIVLSPADGDHDVLAVSVILKLEIGIRDRIRRQSLPGGVFQCHAKQEFGGTGRPPRGRRGRGLLRAYPSGTQRQ